LPRKIYFGQMCDEADSSKLIGIAVKHLLLELLGGNNCEAH
jgi:hypothetical protein